jgi:nucleoid-associated protein YgaU
MADFEALKAKYQSVEDTVKEFEPYGAKFVGSELDGEQLHFVAQVPSQVVENRVWDAIKAVDPDFADLKHEITNTGGADQTYTIVAGDNLSKVSKLFYGSPNHYGKIAEASGIDNPDHIQIGQQVTVPVLS